MLLIIKYDDYQIISESLNELSIKFVTFQVGKYLFPD